MTHKLATWIDQFGTSGCVGCGRCITWCPVAIDITEEVAAIRATTTGARPMRTIDELLADVAAFAGMAPEHLELIAGCAANRGFAAGEYLLREGEPADTFFVIRHGRVALETYVPQRRRADRSRRCTSGDLVGWSWLVRALPHGSSTRARSGTTHAIAFDGALPARQAARTTPRSATSCMRRFAW